MSEQMLFHDNIALFVMASLPYFSVFTVLTFNKPFEELEVSQLSESEEKVNQWMKIGGRLKLIDLLINKQFSIIILSGGLIISCQEKEDLNEHFCIQSS